MVDVPIAAPLVSAAKRKAIALSEAPAIEPIVRSPNQAAQPDTRVDLDIDVWPSSAERRAGFANYQSQPPAVQQRTIRSYAQYLQQQQSAQMPISNGGLGEGLDNFSNLDAVGGSVWTRPNGVSAVQQIDNGNQAVQYDQSTGRLINMERQRQHKENASSQVANGANVNQQTGNGDHALLQDYEMQLLLLEMQNKKRRMMARQE